MKNLILLFVLMFNVNSLLCQNCPTDVCTDHTAFVDIDAVPECSGIGIKIGGDIDNNSDCEDVNGDNCFKWVISKSSTSSITGFSSEIGQGLGCNGEIDNIYIEVDGGCVDLGSTGSQNEFIVNFTNNSNTITIWICDGSSGQVSLCNFCAVSPLLPIEISYFNLSILDEQTELEWETLSEINNDGFIIQRSINITDW